MDLAQAVSVAAVAIAAAALALVVVLGRRVARLGSRQGPAAPMGDDPSRELRRLASELSAVREEVAGLREETGHAVQRVGLVRFDAFADMGGRLSFAAAMLDGEGSGIVFSSINARNETRIYAKPVERGESRYNLSDEEVEAVKRALSAGAVPRA